MGAAAVIVRRARPTDHDELVRLSELIHAESRYAYLPLNPEKVDALVASCAAGEHRRVAFVATDGGQAVGAVGGCVHEAMFSRALVGAEFYVYVAPAHRGSSAAMKLITLFVAWARSMGVAELVMGVTAGINNDAACKLYRHLGFEPAGELFVKRF